MIAYAQSPIQEAADKFKDLDAQGLVSIILNIASWFLLLIGLIAVIMVLWSSFQFVTAGAGKEEQISQARKTLIYSLIGVVIAILAFSVVTFTNSIISSEDRGPTPPGDTYECTPGDPSTCPAGKTCVFSEDRAGFASATCQWPAGTPDVTYECIPGDPSTCPAGKQCVLTPASNPGEFDTTRCQ